jgi:uncharacterized membrane protein
MEQDFKHDNPQNWKWGIFYVNYKDNRLIVPKRMKSLGWTLNFAYPKVWIGLGLIGVIIVVAKFI